MSSPFIFRVLDTSEFDSRNQLYVGTGFFVSDRGYAVTTWHNFDYTLRMERFVETREIGHLRIAPRWGNPKDRSAWLPVKVVGKWSNPDQDVAVLEIANEAVRQLKLEPVPLSMQTPPGLRIMGIGFHRPGVQDDFDVVSGYLREKPERLLTIHGNQRVIEIIYRDIPFEEGMSGGPLISEDFLCAIAMETASDLPPRDMDGRAVFAVALNKQESRGYGTPVSVIADSWPEIEKYCRFMDISNVPPTRSEIRISEKQADGLKPKIVSHSRMISIGRTHQNSICLSGETISREHGIILFSENEYKYQHKSRINRTIIERRGENIVLREGSSDEVTLKNYDTLIIGGYELVVCFTICPELDEFTQTIPESDISDP